MPDLHYDNRDHNSVDFSPSHSDRFQSRMTGAPPAYVLQGRWEIVKQLGQGGMGTVYLCQDLRLSKRLCVAKKLRVDFFREEDRRQALAFFDREAMVLSTLKHPNIVSIYDYFEEQGNYFLIMEYVEGENLQRKLMEQGHPFAEKEVRVWSAKICEVLTYLHTHRPPVIYRDLKPSNIMVDTTGNIKLVDFGIARPYAEESDNTHVVSGGYSPPEQYWGGADPRSDLYGLGATMHFLLTGEEPLALQTSSPKNRLLTGDEPAISPISSPKYLSNKVSVQMDRIVQRATAQDVWLRYQSATEMLAELTAEPTTAPAKTPLPGLVGLFIALVIGAGAMASLNFIETHEQRTIRHQNNSPDPVGHNKLLGSKQTSKERSKFSSMTKTMRESPKALEINSIAKVERQPDVPLLKEPAFITADESRKLPLSAYPMEFALSDSREEILTDPEGLESFEAAASGADRQYSEKGPR